jgi:uncharacterized protein (DUF2267 family)
MDYEQFISVVAQWTATDKEVAIGATRATLEILAERLSRGEARKLADQLPQDLVPWLYTDSRPDTFDADEFVARLAEREGVGVETAERHASAVFTALRRAVTADAFADLTATLPEDFKPLLGYVDVMPVDELLVKVAERANLDIDPAARATDAVLETLAERIAPGEVDDLIIRLPIELHPPLKRGRHQADRSTRRMSAEDFLRRVAEREAATETDAFAHVVAVFAVLREALNEDEFFDVTVQLPHEYEPMLVRR